MTFAEYDEAYLKYLNGENSPDDPLSFLTMHEFGPWDTQKREHMEHLARILLGITIRADEDQKAESSGKGGPGVKKKGPLFERSF